jgi:NADPH2:quinone reductase
MLKRRGACVLATVSTDAKAAVAREAGADETILYTKCDFAAEARRLTNDRGVDVVYDSVGRDTFDGSLALCDTEAGWSASVNPAVPFRHLTFCA